MQLYRELASATRRLELPNLSVSLRVRRWSESTRHILFNASSLLGTAAVTSTLGFVFWWLAAHKFPAASVGFAAAAVSAMTLLGTLSMLGLGTLLIGELPRRSGEEGPLIATALLAAGTAGGLLGTVAALLTPRVSSGLGPLAASPLSVALFAAGVSLTAMTLVLDQALIGLLRGHLQLLRNAVFAAVKLCALFVVGLWAVGKSGLAIYAVWVFSVLASLIYLTVVALIQRAERHLAWPQWRILRRLGPATLGHHALNLSLQVAGLMLPVVVSAVLSVTMNAYFYAAWMLAGLLAVAPFSLSLSLYALGAASPAVFRQKIWFTLRLSFLAGLAANVVLFAGATVILRVFGSAYADHAAWTLRILGLAIFPLIIKDHYVAICRVQGRVTRASLYMTGGALLEVALATLGARLGGLSGLSLGWLAALCAEASFMARPVYRVVVHPASPDGVNGHSPVYERYATVSDDRRGASAR